MAAPHTNDTQAGRRRRRLARLAAREVAIVVGIDAEEANAKRLADLGFVPGVRIQMVRKGTPCIVLLDGVRIGLGRAHQQSIWTAPASDGSTADA